MNTAATTHPILRIRSPIIGRGEQVFVLGGDIVTIGRADDCDIVLLEQSASRLHARVLHENGRWVLVDEDSHGGVFLRGQKISRAALADGDEFRIGETEFRLVERPASQPTLVGATVSPRGASSPEQSMNIGSAPTIASGSFARPLLEPDEAAAAPAPPSVPQPPVAAPPTAAPPVAAAVVAPAQVRSPARPAPASAPSFVDFGAVGNPGGGPVGAQVGSAPSFVDFGPVGRPDQGSGQSSGQSDAFSGRLADDPSRIDAVEDHRVGSRWGTWILVMLLFVGLSLLVLALAFDYQLSDLMGVFD